MGDIKLFQGIRMAIGFKQQTDLVTPHTAGDMWSLRHTSRDAPQPTFENESDKEDLGKGIYATQLFKKSVDANFSISGRLTSEWGAQLSAFGLAKTVKAAAGAGFKYTSTAFDPDTDGLAMPSTTILAKIGSGGTAILDKALIGMCCEEFGIQAKSGAGRDNSTFSSTWVGTGNYVKPSGIVMPTFASEHVLNAGGMTSITVNGVEYLTSKRFASIDLTWKNNLRLDSGYHPGSGVKDGFQIRGRMRRGVPDVTLKFVVEAETGSAEEQNLIDQVEGTSVITFAGAVIGGGPETHLLKFTHHRVVPKMNKVGEADGIASYEGEMEVLQHSVNGVLTIEAVCEQDNILAVA